MINVAQGELSLGKLISLGYQKLHGDMRRRATAKEPTLLRIHGDFLPRKERMFPYIASQSIKESHCCEYQEIVVKEPPICSYER